uniref:Target of Myb protein 1 n=1 Tax=Denticeps clupeoides TaxID=299321 RepID=A0AAY4CQS3_9TELE
MDFLIGSPFSTPVGQRIEHATSAALQSEDWALNMEICDIVNETEDGPKDAVRAIKRKIVGNRDFKEVMLALTVLEACVKNCGHRFHVLVSTREFVEGVLVKAILNNPPLIVQDRVLTLIQAWADAFRSSPALTGVVSVYEDLRRKGLEFPMNNFSPIHTPIRSIPESQCSSPVTGSSTPASPTPRQPVPPQNVDGPFTLSPDQMKQLRLDLWSIRGNLTVMSDMMNQLDPSSTQSTDKELLQQLYTTCKDVQNRLVKVIPSLSEEKLIGELLAANDEINTTFTRYHRFERQLKASNSTLQSPTCANLIDLSTDSKPLSPAEITSQCSPLRQSAIGSLSNQMAGLSTQDSENHAELKSDLLEKAGSEEGLARASDQRQYSARTVPLNQDHVMDDIEKWLEVDEEDDLGNAEGVTSEGIFYFFLLLMNRANSRVFDFLLLSTPFQNLTNSWQRGQKPLSASHLSRHHPEIPSQTTDVQFPSLPQLIL